MNNFHSSREWKYIPRLVSPIIEEYVDEFPVVVLVGPRQAGKSTLLRNEPFFEDWKYVTLDDFSMLEVAEREPSALWKGAGRVIIDEVQRAKNIFTAVKGQVDQAGGKVKFLLSGSANLLLTSKVAESLAGRAVYVNLYPFTLLEESGGGMDNVISRVFMGDFPVEEEGGGERGPLLEYMLRGFLPPLLFIGDRGKIPVWWDGYVRTYLEKDVRNISRIDRLADFRRLMEVLALRTGKLLNQSEIGRELGIPQPTLFRYLNIVETTMVFERVPAYARSRDVRVMKMPKMMCVDPGLVSFLSGIYTREELEKSRELGGVFESFIYLHLKAYASALSPPGRIYYFRDRSGNEVDFVVERGRKRIPVEVKFADALSFRDIKGMRKFMEVFPDTEIGIVVYTGRAVYYMTERILALPWDVFTGYRSVS